MARARPVGHPVYPVCRCASARGLSRDDRCRLRGPQSDGRSLVCRDRPARAQRHAFGAGTRMNISIAREQWWDSDLAYNFRRSPVAIVALIATVALIALAIGADVFAPVNVMDAASANVIDARLPPGSTGMIGGLYLLGTDPQGRDMLSAVIFGLRP